MIRRLLRFTRFMLLLPTRLMRHILNSSRYQDKVLYYNLSLQRLEYPRPEGEASEQPDARATVVLQGGGMYGAGKRAVIDTGGLGGGQVAETDGYQMSAGAGEGWMGGGTILRLGNRLRVYPMSGLAGYGDGITLTRTEDDDCTFQAGNGGAASYTGVGVEYRIGWRYGMVLGARFGVHNRIVGTGSSSRPFAYLLVGVGRFGSHQKAKQAAQQTTAEPQVPTSPPDEPERENGRRMAEPTV